MRVPPRRGAIIQRLRLERVKTYRHSVAVHWGDTDPARIVFYPNYFEWFDQSTRLFFDSVGLDWDSLGEKYGIIGLPVIESQTGNCNYKLFEVAHAVSHRGLRPVDGYEIHVQAHRHPEKPDPLKAI